MRSKGDGWRVVKVNEVLRVRKHYENIMLEALCGEGTERQTCPLAFFPHMTDHTPHK